MDSNSVWMVQSRSDSDNDCARPVPCLQLVSPVIIATPMTPPTTSTPLVPCLAMAIIWFCRSGTPNRQQQRAIHLWHAAAPNCRMCYKSMVEFDREVWPARLL